MARRRVSRCPSDMAQRGRRREPHLIAGQIQGGLDGDGVDLQKRAINEVGVLDLERSGLPEPALQAEVAHLNHHLRDEIGRHGDDPLAPRLIMGTT